VDEQHTNEKSNHSEGIGVDLGIKEFATLSNEEVFVNINKSKRVRKLEKKLRREQRSFSRKILKRKRGVVATKTRANLDKNRLRIQKLHQLLSNIRTEYVKSVVSQLVKTKPEYITIEDLNIRGMMKNRHLSKAIAQQMFYKFKEYLIQKCNQFKIEIRVADRFYPSSKTCSFCGTIKKDLKLKDRTYICSECGTEINRDLNAAINLKRLKQYIVLT